VTTAAPFPRPAPTVDGPLSLERRPDGVAVITYDVPGESVNTLRADFADAFGRICAEIERDPAVVAAVLVSGKPDGFIAGADISMLETARTARREELEAMVRRGHEAMARLALLPKPVVAAVHGPALGGGFEVALACRARVLSHSRKTVLGLPEVQLGLLPGLSGLERLAALVGIQTALDYGLTGKPMRPDRARKLGVADDVVPRPILLAAACKLALALARGEGAPPRPAPARDRVQRLALEKNPLGRSVLFRKAREELRKRTGGHYPATERIVDVLETYAKDGLEASERLAARAFAELLVTDVSRQLIGIFFATTAMKKDRGVDRPDVAPRPVERIAVLGAGLMGAGIAYVAIDNGLGVRLKDRDAPSLARGHKAIATLLDERLAKRQLTPQERAERLALLSSTTGYDGLGRVGLVIEAVFEDLALKQSVLRDVEQACPRGVVFASNTSSIPIARIAEASRSPENVVGMHYFSPVHRMPLLEVIRTDRTADDVVATAVDVGKRQGKTVIVVRDGVGFYTSRILAPYMNEASHLLVEGVSIENIDHALTAWGWPVGPITLLDEVGLDVAAHVGPIMIEAFGERMAPPPTVARLVADDRKGRKNGRGFYLYGDAARGRRGRKDKVVDASVYALLGLEPRRGKPPVSVAGIQERCNLALVNEALRCWGEGLLRSPRDGDIGAIFGLGFPPFRGGPFRWLDAEGAPKVLGRVEALRNRFGQRWEPAPALAELARSGRKLYE
jgi:3-hydroxyacyl-CoA dehydrogenase/enoyl-CoA hydratase/3-hydroxybutyryl-CoA epimerase